MDHGIIHGGWEYITGAYVAVWGGLIAYYVGLVVRKRSAQADLDPTETA